MNTFKNIFVISIIILSLNKTQAQNCTPLTIPQTNDNGGIICLEGYDTTTSTIDPNKDICIKNEQGFLKFYLDIDLGSQLNTNITFDNTGLLIHAPGGPNNPSNFRDITFDFLAAGSAKIRSFRESTRGSGLQFLTKLNQAGNLDDPEVRMHINHDGKVGIGTTSPLKLLDVKGDAAFSIEDNSETEGKLVIRGANQTNTKNTISPTNYRDLSFEFLGASKAKVRSYRGSLYDTYLQFLTTEFYDQGNEKPRMQINHDGKVLIADFEDPDFTSPGNYRLYVANGGILTDKVKVAIPGTQNWSDHVFQNNYKLMPLNDLEKFIIKHEHLPNIPSAKELVLSGLDLAEMQSKQMEKIEELTLYMIEMKKEIELLKKENKELKKIIKD